MNTETEKLMNEVIHDLDKKNERDEQLLIRFLESLLNEQIPAQSGELK